MGSSIDAVLPTLEKIAANPAHPEPLRRLLQALAARGRGVKTRAKYKTFTLVQTLIYNPLQGDIELPACPRCGRASSCLVPTIEGQLICPGCLNGDPR